MLSPPVLQRVGRVLVVRDDLLEGGTKRRAMMRVLPRLPAREFVYASPAYGYAQIALALACRDLGRLSTIFVAKRRAPHARTLAAHRAGAKVVQVPHGYLSNVQSKARRYAAAMGATVVPFGLDDPAVIAAIGDEAAALGISPPEVWAVAGSGVLVRGLQRAWPQARFYAVRVGAEPDAGAATVLAAPERFDQPAAQPPPFPACAEYDAKAWRFIQARAMPGALFWNVGA